MSNDANDNPPGPPNQPPIEPPHSPSNGAPTPKPDDASPPKTEDATAPKTEPAAAEPPKAPEKPQVLCRKKARSIIHKYALAGTAFACLPLPPGTSAGLVALETHLIHFVGKVYGEDLSYSETMIVASGLGVASTGLKTLAGIVVGLVPVVGWGIRGVIAGSTIEGVGQAAVAHFEKKHPGRMTNA